MKTIDKKIQENRKMTNFKAAKSEFYEIVAKLASTDFLEKAEGKADAELEVVGDMMDRLAEIADNKKPSDIEVAYFVGGIVFVLEQLAEIEKRVFGKERCYFYKIGEREAENKPVEQEK